MLLPNSLAIRRVDDVIISWIGKLFSDPGAVISLILTASLVLLYRRQTQIQSNQEQLMEAGHIPILQVDDYSIPLDSNEDTIQLKIVNRGNGQARRLTLKGKLYYTDGPTQVPSNEYPYEKNGDKFLIKFLSNPLYPRELDPDLTSEGTVPENQSVWVESELKFNIHADFTGSEVIPTINTISFDRAMNNLPQNEVENLELHLMLEYQDIMGNPQGNSIPIISKKFKNSEVDTLMDVISKGESTGSPITPSESEELQRGFKYAHQRKSHKMIVIEGGDGGYEMGVAKKQGIGYYKSIIMYYLSVSVIHFKRWKACFKDYFSNGRDSTNVISVDESLDEADVIDKE